MENIARSITLTVDETGTLDYGQKDHNNLVYNTLETHLLNPPNNTIYDNQERDDIISLDSNTSDMDFIYQHNTAFEDMTSHQGPPQLNNANKFKVTPTNVLSNQVQQSSTNSINASSKTDQHNKNLNVTISQKH